MQDFILHALRTDPEIAVFLASVRQSGAPRPERSTQRRSMLRQRRDSTVIRRLLTPYLNAAMLPFVLPEESA